MTPATVLVISDQPVDSRALDDALAGDPSAIWPAFRLLEPCLPVPHGLRRLSGGDVDVVVLDAGGESEQALDTISQARREAPEVPVVLLASGGAAHPSFAGRAIEAGAHDILSRDQLAAGVLRRVLHYAIERERLQRTMRRLALSDPLTGLYTRRGIVALLEHQLKLAHRTRGILIVVADIDGLRHINSRAGRAAGDRALIAAARILKATFRASDVIARLGDDKFAVLVLDAADDAADLITSRLRDNVDQHNAENPGAAHPLNLSVGLTLVGPEALHLPFSAEELLARGADALAARKQS